MPFTRLAHLVGSEAGVAAERVAFIRHSSDSVLMLTKFGASIEEYTAVQPVGSKYDFTHPDKPQVSVVVVIIQDKVYAAYRLLGVAATGSSTDVSSPEYAQFDQARGKATRHCHRFQLARLPTRAAGLRVSGWEGRARTPVQRVDDSFFDQIMVDVPDIHELPEAVRLDEAFAAQVQAAIRSTSVDRQRRLAASDGVVERIVVVAYAYTRSPDVVAEVLLRANGVCERCRCPAPFRRKSDQTPYLEVHHTIPLAAGGLDVVANAEALCPNCHRKAHYGGA